MDDTNAALLRAAALLDAHPDYRLLRALPPLDRLDLPEPEGKVRTALILDTETTSLDPSTGKIIELAICPVGFDARGRIVTIGPVLDWLEDPGEPLPSEIARLTGLSDDDLVGRRIDNAAVYGLFDAADLVVAHNAGFDLGWIEARFPDLGPHRWACSMSEIDWQGHGYDGKRLGGLLADAAGFFNPRHRADADVAALVALLATRLPPGHTAFAEMLFTAMRPTTRIVAIGAPFEAKDRLKARRYRWNCKRRCWWIDVRENEAEAELAWLAQHAGCTQPTTSTITWLERHRA